MQTGITIALTALFWLLPLTPDVQSADALKTVSETTRDFTQLSIEELMDIQVTSVSKKAQKLSEAAAAVFVITQEDIRRSGVTSIPEALRMAPGVQVAHIDANKWAVTVRGFNGRFANKLLVLMDGRSLYTPLFSGVFWEAQDTLLEDIERIEVIRGPGATLWGANAVNGVINIITKKTQDTQGLLAVGGGGTEERGFGSLRYGGSIGDSGHYRIYTKYFDRDAGVDLDGIAASDDWNMFRAGFRSDWAFADRDDFTVQGDFYNGRAGATNLTPRFSPPYENRIDDETNLGGGNLLTRWKRSFSPLSDVSLQLYYDRTRYQDAVIGEVRNTLDFDFQHRFPVGEKQEILWGVGYRYSEDTISDESLIDLDPTEKGVNLFSGFAQDTIRFWDDRLRLSLGVKLEHNDYTGFEIQPDARILWTATADQTLWAAVSRAVRTPARIDHDISFTYGVLAPGNPRNPTAIPLLLTIVGNREFQSEDLLAYECGYRIKATDRLSADLAFFYNVYDSLRTGEPDLDTLRFDFSPALHAQMTTVLDNKMKAETYGAEVSTDWRMLDWWRFQASYTYLQLQLHPTDNSLDTYNETAAEGMGPHHQISLRSTMNLPHNLELDGWFRYVDRLPDIGVGSQANAGVGSYTTIDLRLAWRPRQNLEFSLVGQNLLEDSHVEFLPDYILTLPTQVERSIYGKVTWRF